MEVEKESRSEQAPMRLPKLHNKIWTQSGGLPKFELEEMTRVHSHLRHPIWTQNTKQFLKATTYEVVTRAAAHVPNRPEKRVHLTNITFITSNCCQEILKWAPRSSGHLKVAVLGSLWAWRATSIIVIPKGWRKKLVYFTPAKDQVKTALNYLAYRMINMSSIYGNRVIE